ncbi:hypothetical protein [Telmatospirillum sp.]|uniref:hypothetical protein n=1 Tax=Telmatospirillum sp. TaxID=2079197 RepID=UPI00283EDC07|nr:hypothetical protein [Telmatospirillum sp.]MDR3435371.1 hypothetical protein [Telmatospirillum sp.]
MNIREITIVGILAACSVLPGPAYACAPQEATVKETELSQLVRTRMTLDPVGAQALMARMQPVMQSYQGKLSSGGAVDWDKVCSQYDNLIKLAK